jgi:hypothetical protein
MTLRLTVAEDAWRAHLHELTAAVPGLVPVVKGNGYGFGRAQLADVAAGFARSIAVGTVHEVHDIGADRFHEIVVLTPVLAAAARPPLPGNLVLTVGCHAHVDALVEAGWRGPVNVKLASAMRRYGAEPAELVSLVGHVRASGLEVRRALFHPPLVTGAYTSRDVVDAITAWLEELDSLDSLDGSGRLDPSVPLSTSHLDTAAFAALVAAHPHRRFELRLGTALWHGDKSMLHLGADVLDRREVDAATPAGYRGLPVPTDGTLVMIGAGSAHGVAPLADGSSPFHFARRRLALHEAPHMHTSMAFVPAGELVPAIGDLVDVQRPLITTLVDELVWR